MIPELENFRKKYPGYNDMDDATLASKLASKYPDAYGDLPDKLKLAVSKSKPESQAGQVPEWGIKHPNLYGMAGAARQALGPIAESVALATGGTMGTAAGGPALGLAGAGLAFSGVRRGLHAVDVALGDVPPQDVGQQVMSSAGDFLKGAQYEATGQLVPKALTMNPEASRLDPAMARRMSLSEETGVPITRAAATQKKVDALLETQLKENIGSANTAQKYDAIQKAKLQDLASQTQERLGGPMGKLEAGQIAQEQGAGRYGAFMRKAGEKFEAIPAKDIQVETPNLRDVAIGHADDLGQVQSPALKRILNVAQGGVDRQIKLEPGSIVNAQGQPFKGGDMPNYTVKQLLDDYSVLGKMAKSTGDYNKKRIFNSLREAILDDLASFSNKTKTPEIKQSIDEAMSFYKKGDVSFPGGVNTFRDRQISNALKTNSPEDIVRNFFKPRNVSDISRLKNAAGTNGFQALKQAWFQDLISSGEQQTFSHNRFVTAMGKWDQPTLDAILTKNEQAGVKKLYEMSKIISEAEKLAPNPSGTGRTLLNSAYMWINHPIRQFLTQASAKAVAQQYFSDRSFRDLLISGMSKKATDPAAQRLADQVMRLYSISAQTTKPDFNKIMKFPDLESTAEAGTLGDLGQYEKSSAHARALREAAEDPNAVDIPAATKAVERRSSAPSGPAMSESQRKAYDAETERLKAKLRGGGQTQPKAKKPYIPVKMITVQVSDGEEVRYQDAKGNIYKDDPNE